MLRAACLILFISLVGPLQLVNSQDVPYIACPQYFQYLRSEIDGSYVGKIMIPNVNMGQTVLNVEFSQRVPAMGNAGTLTLDEDKESTTYKISNNLPINYRVDFPIPNVLPKLTALYVNGRQICWSSEYPGSAVKISMQNILKTSVQTYYPNGLRPGIAERPTTYIPQEQVPTFTPRRPPQRPQQTQQPSSPPQPPRAPQIPQTPKAPPAPPAQSQVCGQEGTATPFIHGGINIARGQFPWLAAIFKKAVGSSKFYCSGSLISSRTVLTAAHCIQLAQLEPINTAVQLGRYDLFVSNEKNVLEVNIQTVHMNPDYNDVKIPDADVALLLLATIVAFTDLIRPICLWTESDDASLVVSLTGVVTGWGGDEHGNELSPLPKMAPATIVSENQCLRSSEWFSRYTSARTLCAGQQDGVGPCMGDSGGGLMLKRNGRWTLRGVVSVGQTRMKDDKKQCDLTQYVVYCDVAKHRNWVQDNML